MVQGNELQNSGSETFGLLPVCDGSEASNRCIALLYVSTILEVREHIFHAGGGMAMQKLT